jgi:predicted helicase
VTDIEKRLQIYLTNSLEEAKTTKEDQGTLFGLLESITDEARQADEVKRDKPIMVIVGNPPYSGHSSNKGLFETELNAYKQEPD